MKNLKLSIVLLISAISSIITQSVQAQVGSQPEVSSQRQEIRIKRLPEQFKGQDARDLILLEEYEPWFIKLEANETYTDNAFLTKNKSSDFYFNTNLNIGFETKIAEKFNIRVQAEAAITNYSKFRELNSNSLGFSATASMPLSQNFDIGLGFSSKFLSDRGFANNTLDIHELSLFGQYQKSINPKTLIYSNFYITRSFTSPSEFENFKFDALVGAYYQASDKFSIGGGLNASLLLYDDYFEQITGESRQDFRLTPFTYISYAPSKKWDITFSMQFSSNFSSLESLDYTNFSASPRLRFTHRFR